MGVPLVVIEEHHEAFYLWHYAIARGWIAARDNSLLHIDEHHDLFIPVLRTPVEALSSLAAVEAFTRDEIGIGNFIWPAVYEGIVSDFIWMRRAPVKHRDVQHWSITPLDARRLSFAVKQKAGPASLRVQRVTADDDRYPSAGYILDIDLDYFACNNPRPDFEIEITEAAFQRYVDNPYYYLRIPSPIVRVESRHGRYFIVLGDGEGHAADEVTPAGLDERIDRMCQYLRRASVAPSLIVICRSVSTGYTPAATAARVEQSVKERLRDLFTIEDVSYADCAPHEAAAERA